MTASHEGRKWNSLRKLSCHPMRIPNNNSLVSQLTYQCHHFFFAFVVRAFLQVLIKNAARFVAADNGWGVHCSRLCVCLTCLSIHPVNYDRKNLIRWHWRPATKPNGAWNAVNIISGHLLNSRHFMAFFRVSLFLRLTNLGLTIPHR